MATIARSPAVADLGPFQQQDQAGLARLPGDWVLMRLVSQSEISRVCQARQLQSANCQASYAIKLLRDEWQEHPLAIELFEREAAIGRTVAHRHLVPTLADHVAGPPYFIVMPWLEGTTLTHELAAGRMPSTALALWIVRQVTEALEALYRQGWMHGDIKPANILVSARGHATLLDLGFARPLGQPASGLDRALRGTASYLAPETLTRARHFDIRTDIYALGVTLFEILTGSLPLAGNSLSELAQAHRQSRAKNLRTAVPHVSRNVAALVDRMLAKDPLRRPQTPAELIEALVALEIENLADRLPLPLV